LASKNFVPLIVKGEIAATAPTNDATNAKNEYMSTSVTKRTTDCATDNGEVVAARERRGMEWNAAGGQSLLFVIKIIGEIEGNSSQSLVRD
jgi:hypothetical protein